MRLVVAAVLVALAITPAFGSTIEELSPARLYSEADRVVDGTVTTVRVRWNATHTGLETIGLVDIESTWRGPITSTVEIVVPGGTLDGARHIVIGTPAVVEGERARWFLRDRGDGQLGVFGWAQGKWPVRTVAGVALFAPAPLAAEETDHLRFAVNGMVWPAATMPVPYSIQRAGSDDLAIAEVVAAVDAAFASWQAVPCARLSFKNRGMTKLGMAVDGNNVVMFIESGWNYGAEAAAATSLWIVDGQQTADIALNGQRFTWRIGPDNADVSTTLDLQAVLTHEIGHFSGLGHSDRAFDTMYYSWKPWQGQRTLSIDDKLGLCSLYPMAADECPPRSCLADESCEPHPLGTLCAGTPDPIGTPCNYDRVECDSFCLFTALDLSTGYCSGFCLSNADCPLTHHCADASAGGMTVKVCYEGAQPPVPGSCVDDRQCASGQHCDVEHGACTFECVTAADCSGRAICDERGECENIESGGGCQVSNGTPGSALWIALAFAWFVRRTRSSRRPPRTGVLSVPVAFGHGRACARRASRVGTRDPRGERAFGASPGVRRLRSIWVLVLAASLGGCADQGMVLCGNGWACPLGFACDLAHSGCVLPGQLEACKGIADGDRCSYAGVPDGTCIDGVCFPAACGNSVLDPGEDCDDGNRANDDGCRGDCAIEECGNGAVEGGIGEQCDDADLRNNDGCNSACLPEHPDWRRASAVQLAFRRFAAIVYDPFRQRTVVSGGQELALAYDTWEWDGRAWRRLSIAAPNRRLAGAAFDSARGEVVMFGGLVDGSALGNETWAFDGVRWKPRTTPVAPLARQGSAFVYDSKRHLAVLFGGFNVNVRGDTWELDGSTWVERTPVQHPSPRHRPVSCYDPVSATTLLLGGIDNSGTPIVNDLWAWDGTTWTRKPATTVPTGVPFTMAHDPTRGRTVLLTYEGADTVQWEWDGNNWTRTLAVLPPLDVDGSTLFYDDSRGQLGLYALIEAPRELAMMYLTPTGWEQEPVPVEPPARDASTMVTDTIRVEAVLFGGLDASAAPLADLWAWRGSHWTELQPTPGTAPSPRFDHASAFDAARGEVIIVGGRTQLGRTGETWAWNGTGWRLAGTLPAHEGMAAAYDGSRGRVVAFGGVALGFDGFDHQVAETWEWDGSTWTQAAIGNGPSARSHHAMAYDPLRARVVLFGGSSDYETFNDIWEYDGINWVQRQPGIVPPGRHDHVMVYNAVRARTVLVGGRSSLLEGDQPLGDTWEWDGDTWTPIATFAAPTPRDDHSAAYDLTTAHVVVFGGAGTNETWSFGYDGDLAAETCNSGHDADRDGLSGCADPDCWWACTPQCSPRMTCDPVAPYCGDGSCGALETCRSCKKDCGPCTPRCGDLLCDTGETCAGECP